jgi:hypothetical protein
VASNVGSIRIIKRPPPAAVQFKFIQDQIKREVAAVGRLHVEERKKVVADFETDIEFGYRVSATQAQITLSVVVENSDTKLENSDWTVGELWRALDSKGTVAHDIPKKANAKPLRFLWGGPGSYSPKTRPIGKSGGPGSVSGGQVTVRKSVKHPGFKPRYFSRVINKKLQPRFIKAIDRGVRLGAKKQR